jgi:hypothetical protein
MFAASKTRQNVAGGPPPSGDPYWTSVSLLTNFENNLTFQDGSTNNIALTRNGVVNPSLATPFTGGVGGSEYTNGSTGYVSGTTSTAAEFGTGDFTVEAFVYLTAATTYAMLFGSSGLNMYFGIVVYGVAPLYRLTAYDGTTILEQTTGTSFTLNAWNHVAWVRNGTTFTAYLNGASVYSTTNSKNITGTTGFQVGHSPNYVPYYWAGNISNFRIVKGTAVYTTTFTPPTAPLTAITNTSLLITGTGQGMFDNSTFVDQGPNALTVTATGAPVYSGLSPFGNTYAGSVLFNGSTQYLSVPNSAPLQLTNTGAFTLECWIYPTTISTARFIFTNYNQAPSYSGYAFGIGCDNFNTQLQFWDGAAWRYFGAITANVWTHIAITYQSSGTTGLVFVNGVQQGSAFAITSGINYTAGNALIGAQSASAGFFAGNISNFRITKGTAVYTANFTPPTTPLTAITNTSLLVRGDTGAFYDLSNNGLAETGVNSPAVTTQITKFGKGALSIGSGKELTIPYSTAFDFYTKNATIECWIYPTANGGGGIGTIIADWKTGAAPGPSSFLLYYGTGTVTAQVVQQANTYSDQGNIALTGTAALNAWHHIALTYDGTTLRLFINGTVAQSSTAFTGFNQSHNTVIDIGNLSNFGTTYCFNGYLDDIRITKGVARYTATFTPPTATFPTA